MTHREHHLEKAEQYLAEADSKIKSSSDVSYLLVLVELAKAHLMAAENVD